jgi:hypothetical protein
MSYSSDVAIRIYGTADSQDLMAEFGEYYSDTFDALSQDIQNEILALECESNNITNNKDVFVQDDYSYEFLFVGESINWNSYWLTIKSGVDFFNQMMFFAERLNLNVEFIRMGEEYSDIEQYQEGPDCEYRLSVKRSIDWS